MKYLKRLMLRFFDPSKTDYVGRRDRWIDHFVEASAVLAVVCVVIACLSRFVWPCWPHRNTLSYALIAGWATLPPLYFLWEYTYLPPPSGREEAVQHYHDLCRNVWLAFVVMLVAITGVPWPGGG